MRLLVYEHVTGGGMLSQSPPASLVREADLMLRALLRDFANQPVTLLTTRDPRLPPLEGVATLVPTAQEDGAALFSRALDQVDAAWPTAPETDGTLEFLARLTLARGRVLVGCRPDAIAVAASKARTAATLAAAGIPAVPTFTSPDQFPDWPGPWVVKPDDGAGSDDTRRVADWTAARMRLAARPGHYVAQPWLAGVPLSLSLLCQDAGTELLAVNRQRVTIAEGVVRLDGLEVNAEADADGRHLALALRIREALPGLLGYVGVDLLATEEGPVVLEINPRLTTSYCALRAARGVNVGARALAAAVGATDVPPLPLGRGRTITLTLARRRDD